MFEGELDTTCMLCAEDMNEGLLPAFGECNHRGVCSICFTRMRALLRDFSCPICKKNLEKKYHRDTVTPLWLSKCPVCDTVKRDPTELKKHMQSAHNQMMCQLCIDNLRCFPSEFKVYNMKEYEKHLKLADKCGSEGHPSCEFCRKRYYDKNALFMHLHVDHFTCHICEKQGVKFKYYQNYKSLEVHFRREHCICEDPSCLQKRFIVFATEVELTSHRMQWHPQLQISRNIPVTFRSYRERQDRKQSGEEGSAASIDGGERHRRPGDFDGGVSGFANDGEWQLELQAPVAGPNRNRNGDRSAPLIAVAAASIAPPPPPPSASLRPDPTWPAGGNAIRDSQDDFPGLSGSKKGSHGAMLGNWGKAAAKQSAKLQVVTRKNKPAEAPTHPKDMKAKAAPSKTAAAPIHSTTTTIALAIQASSTPMFESTKSQRAAPESPSDSQKSQVSNDKHDDPSNISKSKQKMSISESDYPPLSASKRTATEPQIGRSPNIVNNRVHISAMEEYPSLPKPPVPATQRVLDGVQDKNAYPPLPSSSSFGIPKKTKSSSPDTCDERAPVAKAAQIVSNVSLLSASDAGVTPTPMETRPNFKIAANDEAEYPALPQKKKIDNNNKNYKAMTADDSAATFRLNRASILVAKQAPNASPAASSAAYSLSASEAGRKPTIPSPDDYPPLSIRIGLPISNNASSSKAQSGKQSAKKKQKEELRKLAFNMG